MCCSTCLRCAPDVGEHCQNRMCALSNSKSLPPPHLLAQPDARMSGHIADGASCGIRYCRRLSIHQTSTRCATYQLSLRLQCVATLSLQQATEARHSDDRYRPIRLRANIPSNLRCQRWRETRASASCARSAARCASAWHAHDCTAGAWASRTLRQSAASV